MNAKKRTQKSILPIFVRSPLQIGNAIRRLRKRDALSQMDLAQKAGLTQATISRIEKGHQQAEIHTLLLILAALNADIFITERKKIDTSNALEGLF